MEVGCGNCGATLRVDDTHRTTKCPYCANPQIIQRPPTPGRVEPTFVLGFAQTEVVARTLVKTWLRTRGFFRDPLLKSAEIVDLRGVYVPAYLYTVTGHAEYQAQIGENYTETYTTTDSQGKTVVRTRVCTEWRGLSGVLSRYVADVLVTASRGVRNDELEAVEPFDLRAIGRFQPAVLAGWIAEEPTMPIADCAQLARAEAMALMQRALPEFMPGDSHRITGVRVHFENEAADLTYVPLWILAARHHPQKPPVRILVNGQTGKIFGQAPLSWPRVIAAIVLALTLCVALYFLGASS